MTTMRLGPGGVSAEGSIITPAHNVVGSVCDTVCADCLDTELVNFLCP